ncbi:MAG: hypothetical protein ACYTE8_04245 [Planctomycetota bacterium]|jgi:hypothetical protein
MCRADKTLLILFLAVVAAGCSSGEGSLRERLRERRRARMERRGDLITGESYEGVNTGQDFTKPFARTENIYRYQQFTGSLEASWFIHRLYVPYLSESGWIFSGRYEIPLLYTDIPSRDNPNGDYEFGLGDINTQFLFIRPTESRWSFASGVQLIWPTASQDQMGFGKYIAGPTVGGSYSPESWELGGFVGALVTDLFDYEGKDNREDFHQLVVQPILNYNFEVGESFWFFTFTPEVRVNWEQNNNVFLPLKTTIGRVFFEDMVVTGGFGVPVVNDYDLYDWQIEMGVSFFF